MPVDTPLGYLVQILSSQYIKIIVLEDYINERIDEFGEEWTRQVSTSPNHDRQDSHPPRFSSSAKLTFGC